MPAYFFDTSAVAKHYHTETGTANGDALLAAHNWSSSEVVLPLTPRASPRPSPRGERVGLTGPHHGRASSCGRRVWVQTSAGAWLPARDEARPPLTLSPR